MTRPRSSLVSLDTTPYYHCICRCVRRAFLCGKDRDGRCYDHRKQWIVDRLALLTSIFAIDIVAYAVMSNHYHVVLHVDRDRAAAWSDEDIMQRWGRLYRGPELFQRQRRGDSLHPAETGRLKALIQHWRSELCNISRFMACMNYVVALRANREDDCSGRFWEGRFKSQALKDETALLACMAYVDLNPVRAGIAKDLVSSEYTSIRQRIRRLKSRKPSQSGPALMPFGENETAERSTTRRIPYAYRDYLELVDWKGRHVHPRKQGFIRPASTRLLTSLGLSAAQWQLLTREI